ncbi:MAG: hypothetical protein NTU60_03180 [Candidatus Aminicenantes bacterium]|nr:hypothetical protein [Candidatus Aminicenantes bacterium]
MNGQKPRLLRPALIGGAAAGILSGIPLLNCLCCLWIIVGAALAASLLAKDSPVSLKSSDGALVGAFTGVVAAVVDSFVSIPFQAVNSAFTKRLIERLGAYLDQMPAQWNDYLTQRDGPVSIAWFFGGLLIAAVVFAAFGALGGVIGAALFGKKTTPAPQGSPPPQAPPPPLP